MIHFRARSFAPFFFASAVVAGCAVEATPSRSTTSTEPARAELETEQVRVQRFLDARYTQADVRHSFRTKFGEDVDCIDFDAQPGVKNARAMGLEIPVQAPVERRPEHAASTRAPDVEALDEVAFNGQPDENGNARACVGNTVPMLRVTAEHIARAGGLDEYTRPPIPKRPARGADVPGCDFPGYAHVVDTLHTPAGAAITAGISNMAIYHPRIPSGSGTHSLAQTWTAGGTPSSCADPTSANPKWQTVEVGWTVDGTINNGDGTNPHLFIFSTTDGYWMTGCYNNESAHVATFSAYYGIQGHCVPFIQTAGSKFTPGMQLPASTARSPVGSAAHELLAYTNKVGNNWNVQLEVDGTYAMLGTYVGLNALLDTFQVGGEVVASSFDSYPFEMGSGWNPAASSSNGLGVSAYHHDFWATTGSGATTQYTYSGTIKVSPDSEADNFNWSKQEPGMPGWQASYFYYGGAIPYCSVHPSPLCFIHL